MNDKNIPLHLTRAEKMLKEAEHFFDMEYYDASVNRSYYAMFHATTAVLATENIVRSSHSGLIAAFRQFFIKTSKIDKKCGDSIQRGFELRNNNDYLPAPETSEEATKQLLDEAKMFVQKCHEYCEKT